MLNFFIKRLIALMITFLSCNFENFFQGDTKIEEDEIKDDGGVFALFNNEINIGFKKERNDFVGSPPSKKQSTSSTTKWQCVHLTVFELDGLKMLCERLRSWSHAKINYPKDFSEDSMELLDRLEVCIGFCCT